MIQILLSTYNGEAFLTEQLDSLLAQKGVACTIVVRDDGSSDTTPEILRRYTQKFPDRFALSEELGRLGVIGSFDWLLSKATAPHIAFCDQDDIWKPNKLEILWERMQALEASLGKDVPILVHSDLTVVNHRLQVIHPSFWTYSGLDARRHSLAQLLISNTVTGCAMLANRALVMRAIPIPHEAVMHDHWFALVAAALGHIEPVYESLVSYRQHGRNAVGAQAFGWHTLLKKLISGCGHTAISKLRHQAKILYRRYGDYLKPDHAELVEGFSKLQNKNWFARRFFMLRYGIVRAGVVRNLWLFFCVRLVGERQQQRNL